MGKNAWDSTKFALLMLSVGVMPFAFYSIEYPAPLVLALVAFVLVTIATGAAFAIQSAHTAGRLLTVPTSNRRGASIATAPVEFVAPEAPGTPGSVRSRAPALGFAALG